MSGSKFLFQPEVPEEQVYALNGVTSLDVTGLNGENDFLWEWDIVFTAPAAGVTYLNLQFNSVTSHGNPFSTVSEGTGRQADTSAIVNPGQTQGLYDHSAFRIACDYWNLEAQHVVRAYARPSRTKAAGTQTRWQVASDNRYLPLTVGTWQHVAYNLTSIFHEPSPYNLTWTSWKLAFGAAMTGHLIFKRHPKP